MPTTSDAVVLATLQKLANAILTLDNEYITAVALESDAETRLAWVTAINRMLDARDAVKGLLSRV